MRESSGAKRSPSQTILGQRDPNEHIHGRKGRADGNAPITHAFDRYAARSGGDESRTAITRRELYSSYIPEYVGH